MKLYKGAGPGTYWWRNDPRTAGGFSVSPGVKNKNQVIHHIVAASYPSPFLSFSTSYAVAFNYALMGPGGKATKSDPGFVYEIDCDIANVSIFDPVEQVSNGGGAHYHDGEHDLILGIASTLFHPHVLTTPPRRLAYLSHPPNISPALNALVFSIRDAEVLTGDIPPACIVNKYLAFN